MELHSKGIAPNATIDMRFVEPGAGGQNVIPDLEWSGAPEGTKSFAVSCYDPDAPTGSGFWHWVTFDIPADVTSIPEGGPLPAGSRSVVNDYGYEGWGGPFPPPGPAHRYIFTVYALPVDKLDLPEGATNAFARFSIHMLQPQTASFTGLFENRG